MIRKTFRGLRPVIRKEFVHIRRDPAALVIMLLIPCIQLLIFGYAIDTDVRNVPMVVWDQDHSQSSRAFIQKLENTTYFKLVGYVRSPRLGAVTYNLVHNWVLGLGVLGLGLASGIVPVSVAGAILIAHVGMDRMLGYGLKLSSFQETHLGRIGREGKGQS